MIAGFLRILLYYDRGTPGRPLSSRYVSAGWNVYHPVQRDWFHYGRSTSICTKMIRDDCDLPAMSVDLDAICVYYFVTTEDLKWRASE
jgi:hypothetical protein